MGTVTCAQKDLSGVCVRVCSFFGSPSGDLVPLAPVHKVSIQFSEFPVVSMGDEAYGGSCGVVGELLRTADTRVWLGDACVVVGEGQGCLRGPADKND